jgi:hypothetical protein
MTTRTKQTVISVTVATGLAVVAVLALSLPVSVIPWTIVVATGLFHHVR